MRFYNHKSSVIFDIYLKLYDSELSLKKLIFKSLLVGESWSWKVTGISKLCLGGFRKINLKNLENSKQSAEL